MVSGQEKIDLSYIDAASVGIDGGDDPFKFIGTGACTGAQGQLRYTVVADGVIVSGEVAGDAWRISTSRCWASRR